MVTAIDEKVPPLGPGDKLSREEFLRRLGSPSGNQMRRVDRRNRLHAFAG